MIMDPLKTEVILSGLSDVIGQTAWYEDIAIEKEELKEMEKIKALREKALELSKNIRIHGADSIDGLEDKYRKIRKEYDRYFEKYNPLMPEFMKQFGGRTEA
jgi:hypothetical protein